MAATAAISAACAQQGDEVVGSDVSPTTSQPPVEDQEFADAVPEDRCDAPIHEYGAFTIVVSSDGTEVFVCETGAVAKSYESARPAMVLTNEGTPSAAIVWVQPDDGLTSGIGVDLSGPSFRESFAIDVSSLDYAVDCVKGLSLTHIESSSPRTPFVVQATVYAPSRTEPQTLVVDVAGMPETALDAAATTCPGLGRPSVNLAGVLARALAESVGLEAVELEASPGGSTAAVAAQVNEAPALLHLDLTAAAPVLGDEWERLACPVGVLSVQDLPADALERLAVAGCVRGEQP